MLVSFRINNVNYDYECSEGLNVLAVLKQIIDYENINYVLGDNLVAFLAIENKTVSLNNTFENLGIKHQELIII